MKMSESTPSSSQAKEALDSIRDSQQSLLSDYIPSVFIRLAICLSFAAILFGYGMTEHENQWALAMWMGAIAFLLSTALYVYSYRLQGIKIRFFPRSGSSEKLNIGIGVVFALLVLGSRFLRTELGFAYSPHVCSSAAGVLYFWLLAKYPTGEVQIGDE
ncbi:MAG: hypothetical protein AAGJ52_11620 [Pseudomonadota bacterium]